MNGYSLLDIPIADMSTYCTIFHATPLVGVACTTDLTTAKPPCLREYVCPSSAFWASFLSEDISDPLQKLLLLLVCTIRTLWKLTLGLVPWVGTTSAPPWPLPKERGARKPSHLLVAEVLQVLPCFCQKNQAPSLDLSHVGALQQNPGLCLKP